MLQLYNDMLRKTQGMSAHPFFRMIEKLPPGVIRFIFNIWPPFRGAGIKVINISPDYLSVDVSLRMQLFNKNYAGVHFGGSLFAMIDPFFMVLLAKHLGPQYIVWDKAAHIAFKKPGKGTIHARCEYTLDEIASIRQETDRAGKYIFDRTVDLFNQQNEIVATIVKTIYVRHKDFNNQSAASTAAS
jgi:acyl-coenzyme A thioesterase PaaI-like protein